MNWNSIFGHGETAARVVFTAPVAFLVLVTMLRVSGKRSISKMNIFDFVFVVALGSALAQVALSPSIPLVAGLIGLASLLLVQVALSYLAAHWAYAERIINGQPALLFFRGRFLHPAMKRERVTEEEIRAAIRARGVPRIDQVTAVVLETDGQFSVITGDTGEVRDSVLCDAHFPEEA